MSKRPTNLKLVFDLETTGLNFAEDEILEAAITTVDGEVLFESRFKPAYTKEWSGAQRVNGISPEDVEDAPGIIDKIGEMAALLQNAETVIAYNGKQFDIPVYAVLLVQPMQPPFPLHALPRLWHFSRRGSMRVPFRTFSALGQLENIPP